MNPQQVRTATFKTVRKGWDPNEVGAFLGSVAETLEGAQNQATAMEARARAAVARLQEMTAKSDEATEPAEEISRALILAQRTADATVADAHAEAERILAAAREEAGSTIDSTREMSASLLEDARAEARRTADEERRQAAAEVADLQARREQLLAELQRIEAVIDEQRTRLRAASATMLELADRGFGEPAAVVPPAVDVSPVDEAVDVSPVDEAVDVSPVDEAVDVAPELDPTAAIERPVELPVRGTADDVLDVMAEEPLRLPVADTL
jgi:DivIVA domain-containing protein